LIKHCVLNRKPTVTQFTPFDSQSHVLYIQYGAPIFEHF
jgi:hypothetical protein